MSHLQNRAIFDLCLRWNSARALRRLHKVQWTTNWSTDTNFTKTYHLQSRPCRNDNDRTCECNIEAGWYGTNCALNCNDHCSRFGATCKKSVGERRWWCECPFGTTPNNDGTQCLSMQRANCVFSNFLQEKEILADCDWQSWGDWNSCGLCGGVKTRSRLAGSRANPACPPTFLDSEICTLECRMCFS